MPTSLTVLQHLALSLDERSPPQPPNGAVPQATNSHTLGTSHLSHDGTSADNFDKYEDGIRDSGLGSTVPVDSTVGSLDWFPEFNDVSSSWIPVEDNSYGSGAGPVIDPETLGGLFHSSFNMWSVMDDSIQFAESNTPTEGFTT